MGLRSVQQYVDTLRDSRRVCFRGEAVTDVTRHPVIGVAVRHAAIDYAMADDPAHRDLAVISKGEGAPYSRYYQIPRTPDDLLQRSALIERATAEGGTLVVLIKEIGTDALCGLLRVSSALDANTARRTNLASRRATVTAAIRTSRWPGAARELVRKLAGPATFADVT